MQACSTCGGHVPEVMRGDICPACLGVIIANSMVEDEDEDMGGDFDDVADAFEAHKDDGPPTSPDEGDIVTSDYLKFYEYGLQHKGPRVECREGERWAHAVLAYCDDEKYWPNVWFINERGDADPIDMFEALHSEEQ